MTKDGFADPAKAADHVPGEQPERLRMCVETGVPAAAQTVTKGEHQ